jgi:hypothetical protein
MVNNMSQLDAQLRALMSAVYRMDKPNAELAHMITRISSGSSPQCGIYNEQKVGKGKQSD